MKKILFLLAACFVFVACGMKSKTEGTVLPAEKETAVRPDGVEVLCFHSKQRCATCIAIEKNARAAIDSAFAPDFITFLRHHIAHNDNQRVT